MLALRYRLAIAGVITATAVALPAAAMASGSGSSPGKPGAPATASAGARKSPPPQGSDLVNGKSPAARALPQLKVTGPAAVSALGGRLHVGAGAAGRAFKEVGALFVEDNGRVDTASPAFAAIASQIGVSPAQLASAWNAVEG
jgi:hypothetical protein